MISNSTSIDLILTIVMVAVGLRSLLLSRDVGAKTAARWREELRALEGSLKSLITEASNSSATLDRRLVRRREELETLLKRIDSQAGKLENRADEIDEEGQLYQTHEELPNPSWFLDDETGGGTPTRAPQRNSQAKLASARTAPARVSPARTAPARMAPPQAAPAPRQTKSTRDMYLELSEEVEDTVQLSTRRTPARADDATKAPTRTRGIHTEVEIEVAPVKKARAKATKQKAVKTVAPKETDILTTPSIIDPTTYSVARRLLARGAELHVVARKLEIPLAEVRLLDKLMRSEGDGRATEEEISAGYRKTERVPAKKIVRPAHTEDDVINLDEVEIFRETITV